MKFSIQHKDTGTRARAGEIVTDHGTIATPIFMPVGTVGSVKGVYHRDLEDDIKAQIILGNTYHLYLRPGLEVIKSAGGLHKFSSWSKPILTDSGGYQVFSLADNRKITRDGVIFKSHIDGSKHTFTPENVVDTQRVIGADIIMALDECAPYPCDYAYAKKSLEITNHWLKRGVERFNNSAPVWEHSQAFFPIVQGSTYTDLRAQSAEFVASMDCQGNAIGGLSVGEPEQDMYQMLEVVNNILPEDKPRYLMGVGTPTNLLEAISLGTDMFDCVMPTRNGRNGMLFTWQGTVNIRNEKWRKDFSPIDPGGTSFVDHVYTRAYLRHLIISGEMLGCQIASMHNLAFYLDLVRTARERIIDGTFAAWKPSVIKQLQQRL